MVYVYVLETNGELAELSRKTIYLTYLTPVGYETS